MLSLILSAALSMMSSTLADTAWCSTTCHPCLTYQNGLCVQLDNKTTAGVSSEDAAICFNFASEYQNQGWFCSIEAM